MRVGARTETATETATGTSPWHPVTMRSVRVHGASPSAFLRIAQVNVILVALNIVSGAAVRLSGSGLGCPDWPNCSAHRFTPALSLHPVIEFSNRMVVIVVTVAAVVALVAAIRRVPRRTDLVWLSGGLVFGILAEAIIGAVVVYTKLNPYSVLTHFLVGIVVLTDAIVLALRAGRSDAAGTPRVDRRVVLMGRAMIAVLFVAIAAGTATTGAGPHAGAQDAAQRFAVPLEDITRVHSGIVIIVVLLTLATLWLMAKTGASDGAQERGRLLLLAMVIQGAIGYTQYFTHLPPLLVGLHVAGATTVWVVTVWFYDGLWRHELEPGPARTATKAGASA